MSNFVMAYKEAELADELGEYQRNDAWNNLCVHSSPCKTCDDLADALKPYEDEYMEEMYANIEEAKKKDGSWKYRKFKFTNEKGEEKTGGLPAAYVSSKSTINQAIKNGVAFHDGVGSVPKSVVANSLKEAKQPKSPDELGIMHAQRLLNVWPGMTRDGQKAVEDLLSPSVI